MIDVDSRTQQIVDLKRENERLRAELAAAHKVNEWMADHLFEVKTDAVRWQWLRQQQGWPDSEAAVSGYTPEQFDAMADAAIRALKPQQEG